MRNFASIVCLITLLWCALPMQAQHRQITQAEYFWDTDPGNGNGTAMLATDGNFNAALESVFQNVTSLPAPGFHVIGIRVRAANNSWGPVFKQVVEIQSITTTTATRPIAITAGELFWDADPGLGNGTALLAFNGNFDEALEKAIGSAVAPGAGRHLLSIRLRDANNNWGPVFSSTVEVSPASTTLQGALQIVAAECFWDNDPGQGNGSTLLAINGNFDEALETAIGSISPPSLGFHKISIRIKDTDNHWGPVFSAVVQVTNVSTTTIASVKLTAAELFWDTDPGQGNGTAMLAFNGNFDEAMEKVLKTTAVPSTVGFHKLFVRVRDNQNVWGPTFSAVVEVQANTVSTIMPTIKVAAAEYFFDNDPGPGDATTMLAFDGNFNSAIEKIKGGSIPAPVAMGYHTLYMRVQDGASNWGPVFGTVVYIDTTINFIAQINGPSQLCPSALRNVAYSSPPIFGNTYSWTITGGSIVSGLGTRSIMVDWNATGPYQLNLLECNIGATLCDSTFKVIAVKPNASSTVLQTICQGQSYLGYTVAGTYRDTFPAANGCDSVRTLQLTVNPIVRTNVSRTVCNGQQYHGYTASGTYIDTFAAATGCDSIRTLTFVVRQSFNATVSRTVCFGGSYLGYSTTGTHIDSFVHATGCDSVRTLFLTVLPQITDTITTTICQGKMYSGYANSGTYTDTLSAASGCDSIRVLYLSVTPASVYPISISICQGSSYAGYTTSGVYTDRLTAPSGCDSIRELHLTVRPTSASAVTTTVCFGATFEGHAATGVYTDTYVAANGCDSIRTVTLTVRPRNATSVSRTICPGQSYLGYSATGTYVDTFVAASGCDSIRTLQLTVFMVPQTTINQTLCFGGTYLGYVSTGTYRDTLTASIGCDSIRILNLTILPQITLLRDVTACQGDVVDGYQTAGVYVDTFTATNGCDSIRTLQLTLLASQTVSHKIYICDGDSIKLGNIWYYTDGVYTDTITNASGCYDFNVTLVGVKSAPAKPIVTASGNVLSVPAVYQTYQWLYNGVDLIGETTNQTTANNDGTYTVKVGDENTCTSHSDDFEYLQTGINTTEENWDVSIYPNPTNGMVYLKLQYTDAADVKLFNGLGQLIYQYTLVNGQEVHVDLSGYAVGVYYLKATVGKEIVNQKIAKIH